jgi:hypothetical protein
MYKKWDEKLDFCAGEKGAKKLEVATAQKY